MRGRWTCRGDYADRRPRLTGIENSTGGSSTVQGKSIGKFIGTPKLGSIHDVILRRPIKDSDLADVVTIKNYDRGEIGILRPETQNF